MSRVYQLSRARSTIVLSPAEERSLRDSAQASTLESLRINHPELFSVRVSLEDSGVICLKTRFGVDITKDSLLEVLLRPHSKRICDSLAPHGRKEAPTAFMYYIVKDALNNLDIDIDDLAKIGVVSGGDSGWSEETYIHKQISYLREALFNLHNLKTRSQKTAGEETVADLYRLRMLDEQDRKRAANVAAKRRPKVVEADLLGLHSAAAKPEINLIDMSAIRKKEIADNLSGLFGGASRTRKYTYRKACKVRKSRKSRRYSRK
jgi:hypothetical protein